MSRIEVRKSTLNYPIAKRKLSDVQSAPLKQLIWKSYLIATILKNCVEIDELLQYYMLNTVINFLFKDFIALWRHLAKTQLLCDAQIYLYNVKKTTVAVFSLGGATARWNF